MGKKNLTDDDLRQDENYETGIIWIGEKLPIDVQAALTALNKRPKRPEKPWHQLGRSDLAGAALLHGWITNLHFEGSNLRGADFVRATAHGVVLSECDLRAANLSGARLPSAHMHESDLRGALIRWADLRGAILDDSDLRGAALRGSDLTDAGIFNADLRGVDLSEVRGLSLEQLADARTDAATIFPDYIDDAEVVRTRNQDPG